MFTGIIEEVGLITEVSQDSLIFQGEIVREGLKIGDSLSLNGTCLTVTELKDNVISVNVVPETLKRSNLGRLKSGSTVNLERAILVDGRLNGHFVQGHVDCTGTIESIDTQEDALFISITSSLQLNRYVVEKGFIAVDGVSLTVVNCEGIRFSVTIVPHTYKHTIINSYKVGDEVNIEVDILGKYIEKLTGLKQKSLDN